MFFAETQVSTECSNWVELVRRRAERHGAKSAFEFLEAKPTEAKQMSFAKLDRVGRAIGATLQAQSEPGQRALLLFKSSEHFISAFFGCLYAGVIPVPAYPPQSREAHWQRLERIADDAGVTLVLSSGNLIQRMAAGLDQLPSLSRATTVAIDEIPLDDAGLWRERPLSREDIAFLQYTSGSTGNPKGVQVTHGNLLHNAALFSKVFHIDERSRMVSWLPLFHDMGLIGCMLGPVAAGATCFQFSPASFIQRPMRWLQAISQHRGTISGAPNFAYDLCVKRASPDVLADLDLSSWQLAFNGAEPIRADTLRRFAKTFASCGFRASAASPCYGLAEGTLFVCGYEPAQPATVQDLSAAGLALHRVIKNPNDRRDTQPMVSSGPLNPEQRVLIVDPETARPCASDRVGEIWIQGASVATGYWQRPEITETYFRAYTEDGEGPFLRTGDLGYVDHDELFVTGRLKDLIIVHGRNHYPTDIETTVQRAAPGLRPNCGAAFAVSKDGTEQLVVVQEVARGAIASMDADDVMETIRRDILENHDIQVGQLLLVEPGTVPKTSSGKIQRRLTRVRLASGELKPLAEWHRSDAAETASSEAETDAPQSPTGAPIAKRLWAAPRLERRDLLADHVRILITEALDRGRPESLRGDQKLFELGLDSISALELKARVEDDLGCELPVTLVFDYPTIDALIDHVHGRVFPEQASIPVPKSDSRTSASEEDDLDALSDADLAERLAQTLNQIGDGRP
ncbi:AMP-binding protein [Sulfidibacter corallicola]|uniref:AMP-binding protein n=1 Tax=Sulfidibacter corallicola TaxID=2818388 RepID=A0A8A4TFU3_SULCO|nr:AMP-binding protein [Sulfidibacter corallicola]QTD48806.1 AMP-binding protein [Sulfidibacter corallicola]